MSPKKPSVPSERLLFAKYSLWQKYVDPDGLISAADFRDMDDDDKREAMRELGGAHPAEDAAGVAVDGDDDSDDDALEVVEETAEEGDDMFVDLSDDIVDPRSE